MAAEPDGARPEHDARPAPRFGLRIPPCRPVTEVAALAARAEEAGFDSAWFPDSQVLWRDAFVTLAFAAERTSTLSLGTAVTNVTTRDPSVVAAAVHTAADLAPGRVRLGLGTGNSSVRPIGGRPATRAELAAGIDTIRALLAGEAVRFAPEVSTAMSGLDRDRPAVPIHVAATGPRNLRFAGATGDGVIVMSGTSPTLLERSLAAVRAGAEASGRRLADLDVVAGAFCHVTDDVERDARLLKPVCAVMAQTGATEALAAIGIDLPDPGPIGGVHPDLLHADDWEAAMAACDPIVSDEVAATFAREFCLFGTPDEIAQRIDAAHALGVTTIYVQHVGSHDLPEQLLEDVAAHLLPRYAAAPRA